MTQRDASGLLVEQAGEVTVVRFTLSEIMSAGVVEAVGRRLFALVEDDGRRELLLDLAGVRKVCSAFLGKLIALHKQLLRLKGRLAACGLEPETALVFELCQLPRLFHIYPAAEDALRGPLGSAGRA